MYQQLFITHVRIFVITFALSACIASPFAAEAAKHTKNTHTKKAVAPVAAPKPEAAQPAANLNPIAQTFASKGVTACAPRINQVSNFLSTGGSSGAFVFVPPSKPNSSVSSLSLEVVAPNQASAYASASFTPHAAGGCTAVYDAVAWWPTSCDTVAKTQFAGKKVAGALKKDVAILELDTTTRVFLMPAGAGCVSIKKEVLI